MSCESEDQFLKQKLKDALKKVNLKKKLAKKMKVIRESNEIANEQLKNHGAK